MAEELKERTGQEIRITVPGHTQRGGSPCPYDRVLATRLGAAAAELIMTEQYGYMVGIRNGETTKVPLKEVAGKLKTVQPDSGIVQKGTVDCFPEYRRMKHQQEDKERKICHIQHCTESFARVDLRM